MKTIILDAAQWKSFSDYCRDMRNAIQAPEIHGCTIDAFLDSMVWGGVNTIPPPYTIRIKNLVKAPLPIAEEVKLLKECIKKARAEHVARHGRDVDVQIEIDQSNHSRLFN